MQQLVELFGYQFFTHAFIGILLTGIASGFIGTYIVARKMVFVTDGVTHASFGGIGIAYYLGLPPFLGAVLFGVATALGIEWAHKKGNIREDSAIAILWSMGMAVGVLFVYLTPGYTPNLMSFLFGNILNITSTDLWAMATVVTVTGTFFLVFFHPLLYSAFDPEFSKAAGLPVQAIRYVMMVLIALTVVFSIKIAGIILVLSIFTIPQAIAGIFVHRFGRIIPLSMLFAFLGGCGGLATSYFADIPSGAAIIIVLVSMWLLAKGADRVRRCIVSGTAVARAGQ
ncbi:MAG: metal ABC transporter permease [Breznakibacter sp.]